MPDSPAAGRIRLGIVRALLIVAAGAVVAYLVYRVLSRFGY